MWSLFDLRKRTDSWVNFLAALIAIGVLGALANLVGESIAGSDKESDPLLIRFGRVVLLIVGAFVWIAILMVLEAAL